MCDPLTKTHPSMSEDEKTIEVSVGSSDCDYDASTKHGVLDDNDATTDATKQDPEVELGELETASENFDSIRNAEHAHIGASDATFWQCVFNIVNLVIGLGLLALPFAFAKIGWLGGFISLFAVTLMAWRTAILIGRNMSSGGNNKPLYSYHDMASKAFGPTGANLVVSMLCFEVFAALVFYLNVGGSSLKSLMPDVPDNVFIALIAAASLIPTIFLKTPRLLSYLSALGTLAAIFVVLSVISLAFLRGDMTQEIAGSLETIADVEEPHHTLLDASGLAFGSVLIVFSFSGHEMIPTVYTSLNKKEDFERVIHAAYAMIFCIYAAVGSAGYYMFGDFVEDQVLLSLQQHGTSKAFAVFLISFVGVAVPLTRVTPFLFPLSEGVLAISALVFGNQESKDVEDNGQQQQRSLLKVKVAVTILAATVSIAAPSISFVSGLTGAIFTMTVVVIVPAASHLRLFGSSNMGVCERLVDYALVAVGLALAILGTIGAVSS